MTCEVDQDEITGYGLVEANLGAAEWIARKRFATYGHAINGVPLFGAKIQERDLDLRVSGPAAFDQFVQLAIFAQLCERGVGLGRITDCD